jgi:putative transposase
MAQFKSRVTKRIWAYPGAARVPIWQRNYHEHIVRNEVELNQIRRYIQDNPRHGMEDDEYL